MLPELNMQSKAGWLIWAAILIGAINLRTVMTSVSPLMPALIDELKASSIGVSFLYSIPILCMGLFSQISVWIIKKIHIEKAISALLFIQGISMIMRYYSPGYITLIVSAIISGVAIAALGPLISGFVKKHLAHKATLGMSVFTFSIGLGAALSASLSGWLYTSGTADWPFSLATWGVLSILSAMFWLNIKSDNSNSQSPTNSDYTIPKKNITVYFLVIFFALQAGLTFSLMAWLTPLLVNKTNDYSLATYYFSLFSFLQLVGSLIFPPLLEKLGSKHGEYISAGFVLLGVISLSLPGNIPLGLLLTGVGCGAVFSYSLMMPLQLTKNYKECSAWSALMLGGGYTLSSLFPLGYAVLQDKGSDHPMIFLMLIIQAASLLGVLVFLKRRIV
ncbi:CP family cyanate transporter-like MFS transporter [Sinobacterium caligoides]|uniref:CP family cyanate transporter-like MFS transporter n=2 Tax=Sinobacterium caligoides TaxID=933926 RepID=A0A3N2DK85_9GAMM|nr:CP family cyanate transporter-like MFS transporter [Sinobacterium caligoides]